MAPTKEAKGGVKAKGKAAAKAETKTKKAVAKATKGKHSPRSFRPLFRLSHSEIKGAPHVGVSEV